MIDNKKRLAHILPYIPFETILESTDGLCESHLLSELSLTGRLYSGTHPDGTLLVVREVEFTDSFESVMSRVASVRHPNIALLMGFSVGATAPFNSKRFLIYEFLQGGNLRDRMPQFPCDRKLEILATVAAALKSAPVAHGGLSDTNILFDNGGSPKLTDFHVAALQPSFAPSLEGDLRDFAALLAKCVAADWPHAVASAALRLVDRIHRHEVSDWPALQTQLAALTDEERTRDEGVQTEAQPLLPTRPEQQRQHGGCCVVA